MGMFEAEEGRVFQDNVICKLLGNPLDLIAVIVELGTGQKDTQ